MLTDHHTSTNTEGTVISEDKKSSDLATNVKKIHLTNVREIEDAPLEYFK